MIDVISGLSTSELNTLAGDQVRTQADTSNLRFYHNVVVDEFLNSLPVDCGGISFSTYGGFVDGTLNDDFAHSVACASLLCSDVNLCIRPDCTVDLHTLISFCASTDVSVLVLPPDNASLDSLNSFVETLIKVIDKVECIGCSNVIVHPFDQYAEALFVAELGVEREVISDSDLMNALYTAPLGPEGMEFVKLKLEKYIRAHIPMRLYLSALGNEVFAEVCSQADSLGASITRQAESIVTNIDLAKRAASDLHTSLDVLLSILLSAARPFWDIFTNARRAGIHATTPSAISCIDSIVGYLLSLNVSDEIIAQSLAEMLVEDTDINDYVDYIAEIKENVAELLIQKKGNVSNSVVDFYQTELMAGITRSLDSSRDRGNQASKPHLIAVSSE